MGDNLHLRILSAPPVSSEEEGCPRRVNAKPKKAVQAESV